MDVVGVYVRDLDGHRPRQADRCHPSTEIVGYRRTWARWFEEQFKFNIKMKERFGVDLKAELEGCFEEKKLPKEIESLVKEVEEVIDKQNVDLKIGDEFGFGAVEVFNREELARNKEEEKKIKGFRKEKDESDRERKIRRKVKNFSNAYIQCFNCLRQGHVARECSWRSSWRSFSDCRR